jgi:hypothetical protein
LPEILLDAEVRSVFVDRRREIDEVEIRRKRERAEQLGQAETAHGRSHAGKTLNEPMH